MLIKKSNPILYWNSQPRKFVFLTQNYFWVNHRFDFFISILSPTTFFSMKASNDTQPHPPKVIAREIFPPCLSLWMNI